MRISELVCTSLFIKIMKKYTVKLNENEIKRRIADFCDDSKGEKTIEDFLDTSLKGLKIKLYKNYNELYKEKMILKRNGEQRILRVPNNYLKKIQRNLNYIIQTIYKGKFTSHAFEKASEGKSKNIITNAKIHTNKKFILKIDLKDFFPSISFPRIYGVFQKPPFNFDNKTARLLAHICIFQKSLSKDDVGELPQGAPTSPILSNLVCRNLDNQLFKLCSKNKCQYSRYADDITISTNLSIMPNEIYSNNDISTQIKEIIKQNGFIINQEKTKLLTQKRRQMVTGLVVNKKVNLKRNYIKNIRAMLFQWQQKRIKYMRILKNKKNIFTIIKLIKKSNFKNINSKNKNERKKIIKDLLSNDKYNNTIYFIAMKSALLDVEKEMHDKYYQNKFDKPKFKRVLSGRIGFVRKVRGDEDDIYRKLWNQYCYLNNKKKKIKPLIIKNVSDDPIWNIINKGESMELELKQEYSEQHLLETINAFLNSKFNGTLIFGVEDLTHIIYGIDKELKTKSKDAFRNEIIHKIFDTFNPQKQLPVMCKFYERYKKTICIIEVQPYGERIYLDAKNKIYFERMDGYSQKRQDP